MASPMVEGRVDPHKKAQYTLHVSDRIADGEVGDYTSVRYNHKPAQPTSSRNTRITSSSTNAYSLRIEDERPDDAKDTFIFTGQKTVPKKSYILLFDPSSQSVTLEPLANSYTFNVSTKNGQDMSSAYPKIYPRKQKDHVTDAAAAVGDELVDEVNRDDVNIPADAGNPFDFRHFLKKGNESEYGTSSPDDRIGTRTGSAANTPRVAAVKKPPASSNLSSKAKVPTQAPPKARKRKSPEPQTKKAQPKKAPTVRLERRATADVKVESKPAKLTKKAAAAAPAVSKIKSAETVHSSDEDSDVDADGEPDTQPSPPHHQRSLTPPVKQQPHRHQSYEPTPDEDEDEDEDHDEEMDDADGAGGGGLDLEFEIPDEQPTKPRQALRPNLGYLASPANGPISLASAASSVEGTPRKTKTANAIEDDDGVIDFGDIGGAGSDDEDADGDVDDQDVVPMDIGPPAQTRRVSEVGMDIDDAEVEEEDPLYKEMMEGLAGGDSSEESEEE